MDLWDPYRMMTSLGHAHFRFRFPGRLHFFRFFVNISLTVTDISEIPPAPCRPRGCLKILGDKPGQLPPRGGPGPPDRNFTFWDRNIFSLDERFQKGLYLFRTPPPIGMQNFAKSYRENFEKLGFENFGGVALFGYHPLAAPPGENFLNHPLEGDEL